MRLQALFGFIAEKVAHFMKSEKHPYVATKGQKRELGFTFSFPVEQTAINGGTLIKWTKGFNVEGTVSTSTAADGGLLLLRRTGCCCMRV